MSNNYDENGNKLVHVKAYNRSDGTYVKEHWRGQGESFAPKQEKYDWPPKEEKYELPDEGCFPYGSNDVMYMNGNGLVLQGGVEKTDLPSGTGGVFGGVLSEIVELLPIIMQIIAGFSGGGGKTPILKGNFEENISKIKEHQNAYKIEMDNLLKNVVMAPNQIEYSKQFNDYVKVKDLYDKTQQAVYKVEHHVQNNDYKSAQDEIQSLQREINASFSIPKEQQEQMQTRQLKAKQQNYVPTNNLIKQMPQDINSMPTSNNNSKNSYQEAINRKNTVDKLLVNKFMKFATPDAAQFWNLFSNNFDAKGMEYIRQNGQFVPSIKDLPTDWQEIVHKKVKQQLGLDDCVGLIFNENSSISKSIVKSLDFNWLILRNLNELVTTGRLKNLSLTMLANFNNANTVGKIDVPIITIDKEGNLSAVFLDVYDFNKSDWNPIPKNARPVQDAGIGTNYYSLIIVKFSFRKILEKLQIIYRNYFIKNPFHGKML